MGISKSYLKDKFQKKQYLQTGDEVKGLYKYINVPQTVYGPETKEQQWKRSDIEYDVNSLVPSYKKSSPLVSTDPKNYENHDFSRYNPLNTVRVKTLGQFNSSLSDKGARTTQEEQRKLNLQYGLSLPETGIWTEDWDEAIANNVLTSDNTGKLGVKKPGSLPQSVYDAKFRPSVEEFKSIYESLPRYNQGYASVQDVDPKTTGIQQGPYTEERMKELSNLPSQEDIRQNYLNKTFGTLPVIEPGNTTGNVGYEGFYEGYNPYRTWTSFPSSTSQPFVGYENLGPDDAGLPETKNIVSSLDQYPLYGYFLTQKPTTEEEKNAAKQKRIDNLTGNYQSLIINENFPEDIYGELPKRGYDAYGYIDQYNILRKDIETADNPEARTPIFWNDAKDMREELKNNPQIQEYIKNKGGSLDVASDNVKGGFVHTGYGPQLAEALLAKRYVNASGMDVGRASTGAGYPVIQNPEAFNLSGYLPITKDMYYTDWKGNVKSRWDDPVKRSEYLRKAGVPMNMWDKVYIHTNPFPIEEYKPKKDAQGNIYKKGGQVKSKLKNSYKNKRG